MRKHGVRERARRHLVDDVAEFGHRVNAIRPVGDAERGGDIAPERVGIDDDDGPLGRCCRAREMRRDERATGPAARTVHGQDRRAPLEVLGAGREAFDVPQEPVALLRPHGEPADARRDRRAKRGDRLPTGDRDTRRRRGDGAGESRLRDDHVGLELDDGIDDLPFAVGGRDDADRVATVEEVQDLVEHLRRLDRKDHARRPFHPCPFSTERARRMRATETLEEASGGGRCGEPRRREERYRRVGALLIPRPAHLAFLSGDVRVRSVTHEWATCINDSARPATSAARSEAPGRRKGEPSAEAQVVFVTPLTTSTFALSPADRATTLSERDLPDGVVLFAETVITTVREPPAGTVTQYVPDVTLLLMLWPLVA